MTIFAVLLPVVQPNLIAKIKEVYRDDHLMVTDTQYLISTKGTAAEVSNKLGITSATTPPEPTDGLAIVFATSGYFGRAPINIWEWLKVKLEAPNG